MATTSGRASFALVAPIVGGVLLVAGASNRLAAQTVPAPEATTDTARHSPIDSAVTPVAASADTTRRYRRMTFSEYADRVVGLRSLGRDLALSEFDQLTHRPKQWNKEDGYQNRLGSRVGAAAITQTFVLGISVLRDERRAQFVLCECKGRSERLRHALLTPFRVDTPGGARLSVFVPASEIAGSVLITSLRPGGLNVTSGLVGGAVGVLGSALQSTAREFWPWRRRPPGF